MSAASHTPWEIRARRPALIAGGVGTLALCVGALGGIDQFFRSYLLGFLFAFGIAFGCLSIQLIHAVTGGRWGGHIRRPLYAASTTLPVLGVLFIPVLLGIGRLYPWARPEAAHDALIQAKHAYLNVPFFIGRAVFFFLVWTALAFALYRRAVTRSRQRGGANLAAPSRAMRRLAGPGILVAALTMTFAAIDWVMSLDPHWFSTMFGLWLVAGQILAGLCFSVFVITADGADEGDPQAVHDLGNFLLVFVMVWAYLSFSQYLIIYAGNVSDDVPYYVRRERDGYQYIALSLIVLHFAVPFLILLSRRAKKSPFTLRVLAGGLLFMRLVDLFWCLGPNFYGRELSFHWMDVAAPVGIGGLWLAYCLHRLGQSKLSATIGPAPRTEPHDGGSAPKPRAA